VEERRLRALWETLLEFVFRTTRVWSSEESIARSWLLEAERIPGWTGGPEYAPSPILLCSSTKTRDV
jgi:hypothetical protein